MSLSREDILRALDQVIDPVSGRSVVQQNMIAGLVLKGGNVGFALEVPAGQGPAAEPLRAECEAAARNVPGVLSVTAVLTAHQGTPEEHVHDENCDHGHAAKPAAPQRQTPEAPQGIPGVGHIIAVASGKGRGREIHRGG